MRSRLSAVLTVLLVAIPLILCASAPPAAEPSDAPQSAPAPPPAPGRAQPAAPASAPAPLGRNLPVALVADNIEYNAETRVVTASGNVEVYYGNRTLTASKITYDDNTGRITAEGPIVLRDETGTTVFADSADLESDLRNGLIRGARMVMGENIRLSAVEAQRTEGRFNSLSKAVYSPCKVCNDDPTPLWRIRARRVIHDEAGHRIYYEDATFDVMGVPVGWLPYFSHPDPSAKRSSGFLTPEVRQSSTYGFGVRVPYYWVIDDQSDLTFSPFFLTKDFLLAGLEYRRAFESGMLDVGGSATVSNYTGPNNVHGHAFAKGLFDLPDDFKWGFNGMYASDKGYLRRYDFTDDDNLTSELFLHRYRDNGFVDAGAIYFQSLRDDVSSSTIPYAIPDFSSRHEVDDPFLGGRFGFTVSSAVLVRSQGTDDGRISVGVDWEREEILPVGVALRGFASMRGDMFLVNDQTSSDPTTEFRFAPLAGVEARYPLIAEEEGGVAHVLEPIAQAIVAPYGGNNPAIPNEDSQVTEFDETNLFDTSHFPGLDRVEEGPRLNLGMRYERIAPGGIKFDATVGRVLRLQNAYEFTSGSGLQNAVSDWVGAWSANYDPYVTVRQRIRLSDEWSITRNEIGASFKFWRLETGADYVFLEADPSIGDPNNRQEVAARTSFAIDQNWKVLGSARRDLQAGKFVEARGGISYENECCAIDFYVKRRFTESQDAPQSTTVGLQIRLFTLGNRDETPG
jgi:LPS-assembly protein